MQKTVQAGLVALALTSLAACQNDLTAPSLAKIAPTPSMIITLDPSTGIGFVGKGDVQTVYAALGVNSNNKWLQDNAGNVDFQVSSSVVTETSWTCENDGAPPAQLKSHSTTTTLQGVLTTVARENSKGKDGPVTGFYLNGWEGTPTQNTSESGPKPPVWNETTQMWELQAGTCPSNPSGFYLVQESVVVSSTNGGGGLQVTINGIDWYNIP